MLGFGPVPEGATGAAPHIYSAPLTGAVLAVLGLAALSLLALMPAMFGLSWLPLALIGVPLALGGACGVGMGYAMLSTRIEIARDGIVIAAPGVRACPFPPVCEHRLRWTDVRAVRHRIELYRIGPLPLRLPVETYAIETQHGSIPFGSYYLSNLEPVLIDLAHRANRPWCEDGEVTADLLQTLLFGAPTWRSVAEHPPA